MRRSAPTSTSAVFSASGTPATVKFAPGTLRKDIRASGVMSPKAYCQAIEACGSSAMPLESSIAVATRRPSVE